MLNIIQNAPTISTLLNGYSVEGHLYARRIPVDSVPENEKEAAEWLQNVYREKDRLVDSFHTTGGFLDTSGFKGVTVTVLKYRPRSVINFAVWAVFSISIILYYFIFSILF